MASISIVVPVFNAEKFLNNCLQSIADQTLTDFECIMVDDGSLDNSSLICKEFEKIDNRFHYYFKKTEESHLLGIMG